MKTKVLIHTSMIVVRIGHLLGGLAYVYASCTYDSHIGMNYISTLIVLVGVLRV